MSLHEEKVAAMKARRKERRARMPTVVKVATAQLREGATDAEALAAVRSALPLSNTTHKSIAWYRTNLRRAGEAIHTSGELNAMKEI